MRLADDALLTELLAERVRALHDRPERPGGAFVLLWLQGQRRLRQNLAASHAQRRANELGLPLVAVEEVRLDEPFASDRHHRFLLEGIGETARDAARRGLAYACCLHRSGAGAEPIDGLAERAAVLVTDWLPTAPQAARTLGLARRTDCRFEVVDAAGVVPLAVSPKAEIGARTLRPKVHARLGAGLRPFPEPPAEQPSPGSLDWGFAPFLPAAGAAGEGEIDAALAALPIDHGVPPVRSVRGGAEAGLARLRRFLAERLEGYAERRNEPSLDWTSGLSPYLHAGHVGAAEVARAVSEAGAPAADREAFLEELIVRRELALNLCARVPDPGAYEALPAWARATLQAHEQDPRPVLLTDEQLERAESPDELWNAAQRQLLREGRIHGYLRMLWGKCLLTWSRDAREALRRMRWLNDRWALDGRDANGAAGFLWCLGLHDRPFPERPIFGTVRSMTSRSTRNKLDVEPYLARYGLGGPPPGGAGGLV